MMNKNLLGNCVFLLGLLSSSASFAQNVITDVKVDVNNDSQLIESAKKNNADTTMASIESMIDKEMVVGSVKDKKATMLNEQEVIIEENGEIIVEIQTDEEIEQKAKETTPEVKVEQQEEKQKVNYKAPSTIFDLQQWSLSVPSDDDNNGKADQIKENELSAGFANQYFYASEDGGMVFKCPIKGFKTSSNTTYTRSELREMLRAGNQKIKTKGPNANNWVLKTSHSIYDAGGYNGQLNATLAVNHVTTTGNEKQVGRVIIGQIHAEHNEPLRIYYRKLPNNTKGSIYFAHEDRDDDEEKYYELIGSKSSTAEDPEDGIALNEKFSYQVLVMETTMAVRIIRENKSVVEKVIDITKSGYEHKDEYMYFKAGVYNQNKTGEPNDYVQATFYDLSNKHQKYVEPTYDE